MAIVSYDHQFDYSYDSQSGELFPVLVLQLSNPVHSEQSIDADAYLDTGAQRSLFDGSIGAVLGIDLLSGTELRYVSTAGTGVSARLHQIKLGHPALGEFALEVGFSTVPISRNLLGRDFFSFVQVGFRERYSTFYITPAP